MHAVPNEEWMAADNKIIHIMPGDDKIPRWGDNAVIGDGAKISTSAQDKDMVMILVFRNEPVTLMKGRQSNSGFADLSCLLVP
jgi:hypothetical protein